jgi:hypothetical protein
MSEITMIEPWLDKRGLAEYLSCSLRSIETALAEGLPSTRIFGRPKFKPSEAEAWLEEHGHLIRPEVDR